jgi:hypothetical protein
MKWRHLTAEARVRAGTRAILVLGFAAAVVIYLTASPPPENPLGYDPLTTKAYLHDLEVYGGKAGVLSAQFREWFAGLWHGKPLAFTVAVITAISAGVFKFFAAPLPPDPEAPGAGPARDESAPPPRRLRVVQTPVRKD